MIPFYVTNLYPSVTVIEKKKKKFITTLFLDIV